MQDLQRMIIERSIQLLIFVFSRRFTMPFAWSFMHMFQEDGKLTASGEVTFRDLMRTKSDHTDDKLPDLIRKREKENKVGIRILVIYIFFTSKINLSKYQLQKEGPKGGIPGFFKLGIGLVNPDKADFPGRIDANLMPVLPLATENRVLYRLGEEGGGLRRRA